MFACAMYGIHPEFLRSVQLEIQHQLRRLQHHPSIVVWSGNNENEVAISKNWYGTNKDLDVYVDMYRELYFNTVMSNVTHLDTSRPFLTSSPSNGNETWENPIDQNPDSEFRGDVHWYYLRPDCWNLTKVPIPRFASEYGYQSFPSFETISKVSSSQDWNFNSTFMMHRQHLAGGNDDISNQMSYHLGVPDKGSSVQVYQDVLYIAQVTQATCVKMETEHYRRWRSYLDPTGRGKTMGTIYWQLNDIWQGASWSSIEYGGRWKVLQYYVKTMYHPILVSPVVENGILSLYGLNDMVTSVKEKLEISFWSFSLGKRGSQEISFQVPALSSHKIWQGDLSKVLSGAGCQDVSDCVVSLQVIDRRNQVVSENIFFPGNPKDAKMQDPNIEWKFEEMERSRIRVTLKCDAVAAYVWLDTNVPGRFDDNAFVMKPQIEKKIIFEAWEDFSIKEFASSFTVRSYYDIYYK
eukprot:TRINITY_DN1662_c0_g1_i1.p1 TRINITY_DN1662_c0_g1~~TRINITY_DN1662_c0_g1_i1.p1  ORF type:complete len:464 (-),score=125.92 TRINITY_DN1662_c0_g1_i1:166-1557(-)